ncbi:acyl-CoA dehydrogenase family protein [Frankia sp. AgB32]|uniref:acyl-CoA dehydrogenase family protein n=1 Tax=Frankia sp. AgB32 TaxID=631119 RepID=UPI00200CC387|nr:acyl-CoA dehydrogenase family protein [Frankia sp. AgB32]MCK9897079.1 acyl-CoA dehydrogenase family protein [Frankia sp. AgB32]
MHFDLTPHQRDRIDRLAGEIRHRLGTPQEASRPAGPFDPDEWRIAAELGLTGLCLPAASDGGGLGALDTALALQTFTRLGGDTGLAFAVAAHLLACAVPVRDFAQDEVRHRLLSDLAAGRAVAANAMTEEEAGSDVGHLAMRARRDGDHYVLDGEKSFASNAPAADLIVTYATTDPRAGFLGLSAFVVPTTLAGVTRSTPFDKMGLNACPAGRVAFDGCRVPVAYRLGDEGQGAAIFQHSMAWERACLPAIYLGRMERQLDRCVTHARKRSQFGQAIGRFQAVSHRIVRMKERLAAARLLLYRACWLLDEGRGSAEAAAIAKIVTSEAAVANSLAAIEIFGGAGYLAEHGVEQDLRDAVPSTIFSGSTDIQRELVAREVGL